VLLCPQLEMGDERVKGMRLSVAFLLCHSATTYGCSSAESVELGSFSVLTFNAALLPWEGQKYTDERLLKISEALEELDADVVCLQEVWDDAYFDVIQDELQLRYPNYLLARTVDESPLYNPEIHCEDKDAVEQTFDCYVELCAPDGVPIYECVQTICHDLLEALSDECVSCIMSNPDWGSMACVLGGSTDYAYDGRNGLAILSKIPLQDTMFHAYDTIMVKRGVLSATVAGRRVHCTHLTAAEFVGVPYLGSSKYESFLAEQRGQVEALVGLMSDDGCQVVAGDLNSGISSVSVQDYYPSIIGHLLDQGFEAPWDAPMCTWCSDNTLVYSDGNSTLSQGIDHVMVRGCGNETYRYSRVLDEPVYMRTVDDGWLYSSLSDHYGLMLQIVRD